MDLGPSYGDAVAYAYRVLGGYLRLRRERDFVMIVIGDHQPPALVTGEGASWDVPVHVISSRTDILDRLAAQGFRKGLDPAAPALGKMHELLPVLLDAFGDREARLSACVAGSPGLGPGSVAALADRQQPLRRAPGARDTWGSAGSTGDDVGVDSHRHTHCGCRHPAATWTSRHVGAMQQSGCGSVIPHVARSGNLVSTRGRRA